MFGVGEDKERETVHVRTTPWTIDRTVNLPFLMAVVMAMVTALIWGGRMDNRMSNVEKVTADIPEISRRLERIDERSEGVRRDLDRALRQIEE